MQTSEAGVKQAVRLGAADERAASGSAVTVGTRWKREWDKNPTLARVAAPSPAAPRGVFRAARGGGTAASHCQSRWGMNLVCRAWAHGHPFAAPRVLVLSPGCFSSVLEIAVFLTPLSFP